MKAEVTGQRANSNKWLRISVKAEVTGSESNSEFREYRTRIRDFSLLCKVLAPICPRRAPCINEQFNRIPAQLQRDSFRLSEGTRRQPQASRDAVEGSVTRQMPTASLKLRSSSVSIQRITTLTGHIHHIIAPLAKDTMGKKPPPMVRIFVLLVSFLGPVGIWPTCMILASLQPQLGPFDLSWHGRR